ncbi:MAG: hypothetical protein CMG67_00485 [Candidatus Marinimicrobia bacterium]|nr:hypothetical protein [Candidatus Neomarinimicrobiota bacterium]|tara:strand:- start:11334 stop:11591 length:258 start_codon:yes stop_codon:yes gene_type:complete
MINNLLKIFYSIAIVLFTVLVITTYFSQENLSKIKNDIYDAEQKNQISKSDLILLKNDTNNVILYNTDQEKKEKIKKRSIWELLK